MKYTFTAALQGMACLLLLALQQPVFALENAVTTPLKVLVRSEDAKFIGSKVGGLQVQVRDLASGKILAHGPLQGGTGDTAALMQEPQLRGRSSTVGAPASFDAELALEQPTRVEIAVTGPLGVAQSVQQTALSLWLLPGEDRAQRPVILHMSGLIVDLVDYRVSAAELAVTTQVTMLCGCPLDRDGLWPVSDFAVTLQVLRDGERVAQQTLEFTGVENEFSGTVQLPGSGDFILQVTASQHSTGNAGVFQQPLRVLPAAQQ
ncbi:hypothetical protein [Haliea sp.]|uniref:hypothetical protein n=1 Tax=Haliea sp. TaxID=1932666 RepID=UPI0035290BD6